MKTIGLGTYFAFNEDIKKYKMLDREICLSYDYSLFMDFGIKIGDNNTI